MKIQGITVLANAKINLTLDVLGKRPDGYHEIDSIMQSISLNDRISIRLTDGEISVATNLGTIEQEDNLVYKAVKTYFEFAELSGGATVNITKNIPLAAGVGGGSADAAAVIWALNTLNHNCLCDKKLYSLALSLGADVPFCLMGGTARAGGVGEQLTPLPFVGEYFVVLVKCGAKTSTKEMYERIDAMPQSELQYTTEAAVTALQNGNKTALWQNVSNTFATVSNQGNIKKYTDFFNNMGALCSSLSGSGPTVFGVFNEENLAKIAFDALQIKNNEVFFCKTIKNGSLIE